MICQNCKDGRESECWGLTKDKTWCDSAHYPKDTVILQAQFCKHLRASNDYCPTCGSTFNGDTQDRDSGRATEQPMDFGYLSLPAETQRDIEDNFVPAVGDLKFTSSRIEDGAIEAAEIKPTRRSIIPRRNKET